MQRGPERIVTQNLAHIPDVNCQRSSNRFNHFPHAIVKHF